MINLLQEVITSNLDKPINIGWEKRLILNKISKCRKDTGVFVSFCNSCGEMEASPLSCQNRNCPICGDRARMQWKEARMEDQLPIRYHHVVFTLSHDLTAVIKNNVAILGNLAFKTASKVIMGVFKKQYNLMPGIIAILHTWDQRLDYHFHIHLLVTDGGFRYDNLEQFEEIGKKYLFNSKQMGRLFKIKFLTKLKKFNNKNLILNVDNGFNKEIDRMYVKDNNWICNVQNHDNISHGIEYFSRYANRVAISNNRIKGFDKQSNKVTFSYKDRKNNKTKEMEMGGEKFVERFCMHILPKRFRKIRYYGFYSNKNKKKMKQLAKQWGEAKMKRLHIIRAEKVKREKTRRKCPKCEDGYLILHHLVKNTRSGPMVIGVFKGEVIENTS